MEIKKDRIKKILLLRMDRIGDLFCTTPAIRAVREAYPDARIDLVTSRGNVAVVRDNPHIDRLFVFDLKKYWLWPWYALRLKAQGYDLAVAFNGRSKTTSRLVRFINPGISVGSYHKKTAAYYDVPVKPVANEHTIHELLRITSAIGAEGDATGMVFPVSTSVKQWANDTFPKQSGRKRVAMFIGNAKKKDTRWPEDRFVALADRLTQRDDTDVYVVAGPGDEPLLDGFTFDERCVLYPGGNLEQLGAFLGTCDLFVTSSTGPMHLAAAVDAPMVAILATFTYDCWRPLDPMHTIVHSGQPGVQVGTVEVQEVYDAVEDALGVSDNSPL